MIIRFSGGGYSGLCWVEGSGLLTTKQRNKHGILSAEKHRVFISLLYGLYMLAVNICESGFSTISQVFKRLQQ